MGAKQSVESIRNRFFPSPRCLAALAMGTLGLFGFGFLRGVIPETEYRFIRFAGNVWLMPFKLQVVLALAFFLRVDWIRHLAWFSTLACSVLPLWIVGHAVLLAGTGTLEGIQYSFHGISTIGLLITLTACLFVYLPGPILEKGERKTVWSLRPRIRFTVIGVVCACLLFHFLRLLIPIPEIVVRNYRPLTSAEVEERKEMYKQMRDDLEESRNRMPREAFEKEEAFLEEMEQLSLESGTHDVQPYEPTRTKITPLDLAMIRFAAVNAGMKPDKITILVHPEAPAIPEFDWYNQISRQTVFLSIASQEKEGYKWTACEAYTWRGWWGVGQLPPSPSGLDDR